MFLNAIGIYAQKKLGDNVNLKKIQYAQSERDRNINISHFFKKNKKDNNQLKNIDNKLLMPGELRALTHDNEYHYFYRPTSTDFVLAVSSRTIVESKELTHLLWNMQYIFLYPDKGSLENIIANPVLYTGRFMDLGVIQDRLDETTRVMFDNFKKLEERYESINNLLIKSEALLIHSTDFERKVPKKNYCC